MPGRYPFQPMKLENVSIIGHTELFVKLLFSNNDVNVTRGTRTLYSWCTCCFSVGVAPTQGRALRTYGAAVVSLQVLHPHRDAHSVLIVLMLHPHRVHSVLCCFSVGAAPTQGCALRTYGAAVVSLQVLHPHRDAHSVLMVHLLFLCRCCTHTGTRTPYGTYGAWCTCCFSAGVAPTQGRALRTYGAAVVSL